MERHVLRNTEKRPKYHCCESDLCNHDNFEVIKYGTKGAFFPCKVGKINCPVLLINGCDDQNWAVTEYAKDVSTHTHTYSGHVYSIFMFPVGFDL